MSELKLWYSQAAKQWKDGLPIGNGRLAAMVYGGAEKETWNITESTFWSGKPEIIESRSYGKEPIAKLRQHFFDGDYEAGERMAQEILQPAKRNFGTNLPMCDVELRFGHEENDVVRELNIDNAILTTSHSINEAKLHREMFATHEDGLLAYRIWSSLPDGVSFSIQLKGRTDLFQSVNESSDVLAFHGQALESVHSDGECGVRCKGQVRVRAQGGQVTGDNGRIEVAGAWEAIIYFAVHTDYGVEGDDWLQESKKRLDEAELKGYSRLKADHITDYRKGYDRVHVDFGANATALLPTDERIKRLSEGIDDDPQLYALFFQYGRYLTLCGAREDSPLPLNLQGIWNDDIACRMGWTCDYHLDINTEMNYYPIEIGNLSESHLPLMRYIERLAQGGRSAAKDFYGCEGWVAHTVSNAWGFAAPAWQTSWGLNVTGGLWIAGQLMEHYEFTLDDEFLKKTAYPVLKESALFFLDYMAIHPKYGWLVTGPSISPENTFFANDGTYVHRTLSMGTTLDQVLVHDLFEFCLEAARKLNTDDNLQDRLQHAIALLPPLQIGAKGQLQEWLEDYEEAQPEHRHLSHLHSLYPAARITPQYTPALSDAAKVTLDARKGSANHEDIEFTVAAFAGCHARLHEGDHAYEQISHLIGELCYSNLLTYSKPGIAGAEEEIYVADGNFGGTAAIAEMLLQSHAGDLHLLPALPAKWNAGKFSGLRARGALEVDIVWTEGRMAETTVKAFASGRMLLRYHDRTAPFDYEAGRVYAIDGELRIRDIS
ncbi:glycosyl hydrolase family 95 catalytic domain-containing protein [Cohnella yongneupensis]|uniref:Glycoside hydrolase N-terminal domain-containing protein n=1 Tax=Cohnella yongneupensis TaxID=425006 RepID=A0ABW0QXZ1_9BACL